MRLTMVCALLAGCGAVKFEPMDDTTDSGYVDSDGDGYQSSEDCDDSDATVHPNADDPEGDGNDTDCDGVDG